MVEHWRPICTANGYEVSDQGRVRSLRAEMHHIMAQHPTYKGYMSVELRVGTRKRRIFMVNRIVCEAFNGSAPTPQHQAAHLDGDKLNNVAANLAWATPAENAAHKVRHGTQARGSASSCARLSEDDVVSVRRRLEAGESARRIAASLGVNSSTISSIRTGKSWAWFQQRERELASNGLPSNSR